MGQETLIFIDDQDRTDANNMAKPFAHSEVRNRAYFNTIGATLIKKFLASEGIDTQSCTGLCSIKKVLEELDVSDIILPNIRIDVRVIFDKKTIFVPKSHFEYDILPDIYVVVKPADDLSNVEVIGFFEPNLINKNNANKDYYFIEKEKLTSAENLVEYIKSCNNSNFSNLSADELEAFEQIIMRFSDNDIDDNEKKYLVQNLKNNSELRDKYIEYENFETLSYKAMSDPMIDVPELPKDTTAVDEFDMFDSEFSDSNLEELAAENISSFEDSETQTDVINDLSSDTALSHEMDLINSTDDIGQLDEISQIEPIEEIGQSDDSISLIDDKSTDEFLNTDELIQNEENSEQFDITTQEGFTEDIGTVLNGIDVIDEHVLEDTAEITDLAGAATGFDAVNAVSDAMGSILFDDETVEAINSIDALPENSAEEIIEPIDDTLSLENMEIPAIEQPDVIAEPLKNTLSLDDVVVPEFAQSEEIVEPINNTLSFDTVDVPEGEQSEVVFEPIDSTLSLDDVVVPEIEQSKEPVESVDNTLSFDTIDVPDTETTKENELDNVETLSFDDIVVPDVEGNTENESQKGLVSFDDIVVPGNENMQDTESNEDISLFDDMHMAEEPAVEAVNSDEVESVEVLDTVNAEAENAIIPEDDNGIIAESLEQTDVNEGIQDNIANVEEQMTDFVTDLPDVDPAEEFEKVDEDIAEIGDKQPSESFGKNLLENLNEESLNNVIIESGENEDSENHEEVSSDFLLSQIDDVLNASVHSVGGSDIIIPDSEDEDKLNVLYNNDNMQNSQDELEEISEFEEEQQQPVTNEDNKNTSKSKAPVNKKSLVVATVLVTFLAGMSASVYLKPKNNTVASVEQIPNITETVTQTDAPINPTENILESNAPQEVNTQPVPPVQQVDKSTVQEMKNTIKDKPSNIHMNVSKIVWDVPASVSSNGQMQTYLKSVGKSIKVSLSTDLLLATEYAYTNLVKVNITLSSKGKVENVSIASGSGSSEIDNIVLQSVNDTIKAIKVPPGAVVGDTQQMTLIIYF